MTDVPGTVIGCFDEEPTDEMVESMFKVFWIGFLAGGTSATATMLKDAHADPEHIMDIVEYQFARLQMCRNYFVPTKMWNNDRWEVVAVAPELLPVARVRT